MRYKQGNYLILSKKTLAKEIYDLTILCPEVAEAAKAGQFVNVKADGFMLRRPISICSIDKAKGTVRIIFEVRGEGTKVMSQLSEGEMIDLVAPLGGRAFKLEQYDTAVIVGGGIGTPPMLAVAEKFGEKGLQKRRSRYFAGGLFCNGCGNDTLYRRRFGGQKRLCNRRFERGTPNEKARRYLRLRP